VWQKGGAIRDLTDSAAVLAVFLSNFYFLSPVDYFVPGAELQPLLNTRSLAVEEQLELLIALAFVLLWRRGRGLTVGVLAIVAVLSLTHVQWAAGGNPARNFFF